MQAAGVDGGMTLDWLWPIIAAPFVGSFLGVLIERLPAGRPVTWARSACGACWRMLGPAEMVPILSFLVLRGRCRGCGAPIGRAHLWVELAATAVALWAVLASGEARVAWLNCGLGWALLALAWIDARHFLLPDVLTLPLVLGGLAGAAWLDPDGAGGSETAGAAAAAALGYLGLRAVALGFRAWRGRDGLGHGDAKLAAAAGAWVGLDWLGTVIVLAAVLAAGFALLRQAQAGGPGRLSLRDETRIPFGPFIAAALWLVRLYGSG